MGNLNLKDILITEQNIKSMVKNNYDDFNVKKLLNNYSLTQSQNIRFGKVFECFIKDIITNMGYELINKELIDVYQTNTKTNKNKKELDICFIKDDTVYYFECKVNLNLDSEKSKATDRKVLDITNYLINENPNKKIYSGILTCWWDKEVGMNIKTQTNLIFIKDLFELIGVKSNKDYYYKVMSDFGEFI